MFLDSKTMVTLVKVLLNWLLDGINHGNPIPYLSCCDLYMYKGWSAPGCVDAFCLPQIYDIFTII